MRPSNQAWLRLAVQVRWLLLCAAGLTACSAPLNPSADEGPVWHTVVPGLQQFSPQTGTLALRLDLRATSLRLRLSAEADKGLPIDARPDALAALAAINASFFDREFHPRGHTVSHGRSWHGQMAVNNSPFLACDVQQRCAVDLQPPYTLPANTVMAVAGTPWLVRQGQARSASEDASCEAFCAREHPRTALGLSRDGRWLIVLLAEGRRLGVPGLSLASTAALLRDTGAWEGFNLDGGGSTALLMRGESKVQRPANEPAHRPLANVLLIEARWHDE